MNNTENDDSNDFMQIMAGVKKFSQDTITPQPAVKKIKPDNKVVEQKQAQREADFYFSDTYEAYFADETAISWLADDAAADAVKLLKRGFYEPELLLDLHGMTQAQAKLELAALMSAAQQQNVQCITVMTGIGAGVLKKRLPHWLVQHPQVLAIAQATKKWGGKSALLVLLRVAEGFEFKR